MCKINKNINIKLIFSLYVYFNNNQSKKTVDMIRKNIPIILPTPSPTSVAVSPSAAAPGPQYVPMTGVRPEYMYEHYASISPAFMTEEIRLRNKIEDELEDIEANKECFADAKKDKAEISTDVTRNYDRNNPDSIEKDMGFLDEINRVIREFPVLIKDGEDRLAVLNKQLVNSLENANDENTNDENTNAENDQDNTPEDVDDEVY